MSDIELATLAGFFAGEGSITISGGKWPTLYAALGNTEKFWVEKFFRYFGGAYYLEKPKYESAKFMFRWRVTGKDAIAFLVKLKPYLIGEKAQQLEIALRFQVAKTQNPHKKYPAELILEMNKEREQLQLSRRAAAETNRRDATTLAK